MEGNTKTGLILAGVYALAGVATGLLFGRAQYHQGKIDAYDDITKDLKKLQEETEQMLGESKEEEA